jgi:hypothetical protein
MASAMERQETGEAHSNDKYEFSMNFIATHATLIKPLIETFHKLM